MVVFRKHTILTMSMFVRGMKQLYRQVMMKHDFSGKISSEDLEECVLENWKNKGSSCFVGYNFYPLIPVCNAKSKPARNPQEYYKIHAEITKVFIDLRKKYIEAGLDEWD